MVTVNVLGLGVPVRCAASGGDASRSNHDDVFEMMDERARRRQTAHPCANATACLPIKWDAIPVSADSYASPSDQTPCRDRAPL